MLRRHVFPHVGDVALGAFRPRHARDLVRALLSAPDGERLAPRSIHHVFSLVHNVLESALVDEYVTSNPVTVQAGVLPAKVDADPEWRMLATFKTREVESLISDPRLPMGRRVLHALKSLAGLRHGEACALAWRHIDFAAEPLAKLNVVRAWSSKHHRYKATKTQQVRVVPLHPALRELLEMWRRAWQHHYGRAPTEDDLVAPTKTFRPVDVKDYGDGLVRDLEVLGLRVDAGDFRDRGGHDLRAWYETQCIDDGADTVLIRRTTHAPPKDVNGGYERFAWSTLCREVGKLRVRLIPPREYYLQRRSAVDASTTAA